MMRTILLAGCVAEQPKTVPWGNIHRIKRKRLKANDIEFIVKGDQLLISQNQVDQATRCCT